jgi:hypothetical protein
MLDHARDRGELWDGLDNDRVVEWTRGACLLLILREDIDHDAERALLKEFLLPSLVAQ